MDPVITKLRRRMLYGAGKASIKGRSTGSNTEENAIEEKGCWFVYKTSVFLEKFSVFLKQLL